MATHTIDLDEAKACLAELIDEAQAGDQVIITRQAHPVAMLVPMPHHRRPRQPGTAAGMMTIAGDFDAPLEEFEDYTR